jgi:serine/threonine-protein kinase HipA
LIRKRGTGTCFCTSARSASAARRSRPGNLYAGRTLSRHIASGTCTRSSYSALATILLRLGHPDRHNAMRGELFKRMVFNIRMDNTDDHERNHCLRLNFDGCHDLAPAFDVLPTLQNLGYQSWSVGAHGAASTLENALTELSEFGIKRLHAIELIQAIAGAVDGWSRHFEQHGDCSADREQLGASIDRDSLTFQRREFCEMTAPGSDQTLSGGN